MPQMWFIESQYLCVFNIELSFLLFVLCLLPDMWGSVFERIGFMLRWFSGSGQQGFVKELSFGTFIIIAHFFSLCYFDCSRFSSASPCMICRWRIVFVLRKLKKINLKLSLFLTSCSVLSLFLCSNCTRLILSTECKTNCNLSEMSRAMVLNYRSLKFRPHTILKSM